MMFARSYKSKLLTKKPIFKQDSPELRATRHTIGCVFSFVVCFEFHELMKIAVFNEK